MTTDMDTSVEQMTRTPGAIQPTPTSVSDMQMTTSSGDVLQPTTTSETPPSTAGTDNETGVAVITVDGDFNTITGGDGANYCQQTEPQIAEQANVTANRVDNC